ncbi:deoxyribonuclease-1-like 1 isoform X2 [Mastacembelus armatus]|uniref:Deoxyribonuclease n=1 Tax=Mastacembelus armatus TaxID=205130 RepID=A0A3Q3LXY8_9TELE|nr:deoxyribonuclease-1-like 1 isoform X2 [Mastacembelus armatus]
MRWCCPYLPLLLLLSFLLLFVGRATVSGVRICSYNVQKMSPKKLANYRVTHTLTRVVSRCDICLLQDVIDPTGKAVKALLASLNRYDESYYQSVSSRGLGNSPDDMQQYVFLYRTQAVQLTGQYQYKSNNKFVRDPFVVQFQSNKTDIKEFILVPLHSDPLKAVQEIDQLYEVFKEVSTKWNNTNVMLLGDFHAACAYMTRSDKKNIRLFTISDFSWLIGDRVDTTVKGIVNCAYDRIVVYGQPFLKAIEPFSAQVFDFGKEFKLPRTRVLEVSDHFPVEVMLKSSALLLQATPILILLSASVFVQSFLSSL